MKDITQVAELGSLSRCLHVAAKLGVADLVHECPKSVDELAEATGTQRDPLWTVLRTLSSAGVFTFGGDGKFGNSPLSEELRSDHPFSQRHYAILASGFADDAIGHLEYTVRTGEPAFQHVHGGTVYEYLEHTSPDVAEIYDLGMEDLTRRFAADFAQNWDFTRMGTVMDLGGGRGALLKAVLTAHPHLKGIVGDREDVCFRAAKALPAEQPGLVGRLRYRPIDLLTEVPAGPDLYLLKNVLPDCDPESSAKILENIRAAILETRREPKLLVIEPVAEADENPWLHEIFRMVLCETGSVTEEDRRHQLEAAGFTVSSVTELPSRHHIFECVANA